MRYLFFFSSFCPERFPEQALLEYHSVFAVSIFMSLLVMYFCQDVQILRRPPHPPCKHTNQQKLVCVILTI